MKRILLFFLVAVAFGTTCQGKGIRFADFFNDSTLRINYYREGCKTHDTVLLAQYILKHGGWAGSTTQLLDPFDNGAYRIVVVEQQHGKIIYSRTYNTIFKEYCDTQEGKSQVVRYEEVMNIPFPKVAVEIQMQRRDSNEQFVTQAIFAFDPATTTTTVVASNPYYTLQQKGNPHNKMDVVIVPEGYGAADAEKMRNDFEKFKKYLLGQEPFNNRRSDFNVYGVIAYGEESGITDPNKKIFVKSAVGSSYNTFGSDRYLMTFQLFKLHDLLDGIPCDHIIIMANSDTYGGGAIYNFYAMSSLNKMANMILPHELGHSIGGLADEYVDEDLSYGDIHTANTEPIEPNITTLVDFKSKWADMVPRKTPIPTPDNTEVGRYENGPIGAYEGAGYHTKGIYRPVMHCMMRDYAPFCPVCSKRLNEVFDLYTK